MFLNYLQALSFYPREVLNKILSGKAPWSNLSPFYIPTYLYGCLVTWLQTANLGWTIFRNVKYSKHVTYSTFLEGWGLPTLNNLSSLQDSISVLPFYSEGTGIQFASTNGDGLHLSYTIYSISLQPNYSQHSIRFFRAQQPPACIHNSMVAR